MSLLSETIYNASNGHAVDEIIDACRGQPAENGNDPCELRTRLEFDFVGLIADKLLGEIRHRTNIGFSYHDWIYIPNLRAEKKVGCDLSMGRIDHSDRIRSMHKVINSWCDKQKRWSLSKKHDRNHLWSLIRDSRRSDCHIKPYLVLHTCYCLHDYRRMGLEFDGFTNPDPDSLLRTVIIPIEPLARLEEINERTKDLLDLKYHRRTNTRLKNESSQDYLERISSLGNHHCSVIVNERTVELPVLTLEQYIQEAALHLLSEL